MQGVIDTVDIDAGLSMLGYRCRVIDAGVIGAGVIDIDAGVIDIDAGVIDTSFIDTGILTQRASIQE